MSHLLFRLRNVPEEEARAVCDLLDANHIDYFETSAGNWGISMPAIWLKNDTDIDKATQLLETFQRDYQQSARAEFEATRARGQSKSFWTVVQKQPLLALLVISFCLFIVYVSTQPFLNLMR